MKKQIYSIKLKKLRTIAGHPVFLIAFILAPIWLMLSLWIDLNSVDFRPQGGFVQNIAAELLGISAEIMLIYLILDSQTRRRQDKQWDKTRDLFLIAIHNDANLVSNLVSHLFDDIQTTSFDESDEFLHLSEKEISGRLLVESFLNLTDSLSTLKTSVKNNRASIRSYAEEHELNIDYLREELQYICVSFNPKTSEIAAHYMLIREKVFDKFITAQELYVKSASVYYNQFDKTIARNHIIALFLNVVLLYKILPVIEEGFLYKEVLRSRLKALSELEKLLFLAESLSLEIITRGHEKGEENEMSLEKYAEEYSENEKIFEEVKIFIFGSQKKILDELGKALSKDPDRFFD